LNPQHVSPDGRTQEKPLTQKYKFNKKERPALEDLQIDKSITMKPANIGGDIF